MKEMDSMPNQVSRLCEALGISQKKAASIFRFQLYGCYPFALNDLHCPEAEWQYAKETVKRFLFKCLEHSKG